MGTTEINGEVTHDFLDRTYIKNVIENIERTFDTTLENYGSSLERGYHLEVEIYDIIVGGEVSRYRIIIGCANFSFTLGRFDVHFSASTMGRYNAVPRNLNLGTMIIISGYLNNHMKLWIMCYTFFMEDQVNIYLELNFSELYYQVTPIRSNCHIIIYSISI